MKELEFIFTGHAKTGSVNITVKRGDTTINLGVFFGDTNGKELRRELKKAVAVLDDLIESVDGE